MFEIVYSIVFCSFTKKSESKIKFSEKIVRTLFFVQNHQARGCQRTYLVK